MKEDCCGKSDVQPVEPTCQVCGLALDTGKVVRCASCQTPHHRDCWRYNRGCAVFGCTSRMFEECDQPTSQALSGDTFSITCPVATDVDMLSLTIFLLTTMFPLMFLSAMFSVPFLPMMIAILIPFLVFTKRATFRLVFDKNSGSIARQLRFGSRLLSENKQWLQTEDIVELHLHNVSHRRQGERMFLYAALEDGTRRRLGAAWTRGKRQVGPADLSAVAEQVAEFTDSTIRLLTTAEAPSTADILEAAAERKLITDGAAGDDGDDEYDGNSGSTE